MIYSFNTISYAAKKVVIDLQKVRGFIGAHHGEPDERIEDILCQACEEMEKKSEFYIFAQTVEMRHSRPDIWIRKGPVQAINSIHVKQDRSWKEIFNIRDGKSPDEVEKVFSEMHRENNGTRWIKIHNWKENQQVKIFYKAGYWDDESPHKIPYSVQEYILTKCYQIYTMSLGSKEFREVQKSIVLGLQENQIRLF